MSVEHIRKYLGLFEEEAPRGFRSYPAQTPAWNFADKQKEIYQKYPDKIVYNPTGPRTLSNVDWEETEKNISGTAASTASPAPTPAPQPSPTTSQQPAPSKPAEKPYDLIGGDEELSKSKDLLANLKKDFQYKFNKPLTTNSEERAKEKQQDLYDRWKKGEKGIYTPTNPANYPDAKWFHLNAFDASNISAKEEEWLKSVGWVRTNKVADPVHWSYIGKPAPRPMTPEKKQWIEQAKKNNPDIDDDLLSDHYDKFIYPGTQVAKPGQKPTAKKEKQPAVVADPNKAENDRKRAEELAKAAEKMRQEVGAPKPGSGMIKRESLAQSIVESFGYKLEAYDDTAVDLIRQRNIDQGKASDLETGWEAGRRQRRQQRKEKEAELAKQRANAPSIDTPKNPGMARFTVGDDPSNKVSRLDMLDRPIPSQQDIVSKRFTDAPPDTTSIKGEPRNLPSNSATTPGKSMFGKALKVGGAGLGAVGTALSIKDIYNDINAGDYSTAALEVASNVAYFLGIPFGLPGFVGATAASFYLGNKAEQSREQRIAADKKTLKAAEDLLQKCQLTLNTGRTAQDDQLDDQTKEFLQQCINDANFTIDKLKGRI